MNELVRLLTSLLPELFGLAVRISQMDDKEFAKVREVWPDCYMRLSRIRLMSLAWKRFEKGGNLEFRTPR